MSEGVLYELLLVDATAEPLIYRGTLVLDGETFALEVEVSSGGDADGPASAKPSSRKKPSVAPSSKPPSTKPPSTKPPSKRPSSKRPRSSRPPSARRGADGLTVVARCPDAPEQGREALGRVATIMVRSAVRGARKHLRPPPRRVRRWRPLPRELAS